MSQCRSRPRAVVVVSGPSFPALSEPSYTDPFVESSPQSATSRGFVQPQPSHLLGLGLTLGIQRGLELAPVSHFYIVVVFRHLRPVHVAGEKSFIVKNYTFCVTSNTKTEEFLLIFRKTPDYGESLGQHPPVANL